ncbi:hypothetical protein CLOBOL_05329 [Enterocloster bolteae ATCC BAA-613]|uniref:Uncharacterized protein n=1 Tax=Enterocloster bolteae (strain ATCC BAA-613 / DSM 15670 / CCUG 46953 / JCM 12243 / WAL 16351) TaxID=411902 RepID=A8RZ56_ENTBW|nr:hypothetical protein CLOBOL_05329 [Enterocloster bolteae ATCC BAA-613]
MLHRLCPRILADTGKNKEQADAPEKSGESACFIYAE